MLRRVRAFRDQVVRSLAAVEKTAEAADSFASNAFAVSNQGLGAAITLGNRSIDAAIGIASDARDLAAGPLADIGEAAEEIKWAARAVYALATAAAIYVLWRLSGEIVDEVMGR